MVAGFFEAMDRLHGDVDFRGLVEYSLFPIVAPIFIGINSAEQRDLGCR